MYCPKCGKEIPDGAKFCAFCGNSLQVQKSSKPKRSIIIVILCVVCAVLAGLCVLLLINSQSGDENGDDISASSDVKDTSRSDETSDPPEISYGFKSEEELLYAYIDWLNGGISDDEFIRHYDCRGEIAYMLWDDGKVDDFETGLQAADAYFDQTLEDEELLKEVIDFIGADGFVSESEIVSQVQSVVLPRYHELASHFAPFERTVISDDIYQHKNTGVATYSIRVKLNDPGSTDDLPYYTVETTSLNIYYYCRDGLWYWILVNNTV